MLWELLRTPFDKLQLGDEDPAFGLEAVFALTPRDIWAVGNHLIVRYH